MCGRQLSGLYLRSAALTLSHSRLIPPTPTPTPTPTLCLPQLHPVPSERGRLGGSAAVSGAAVGLALGVPGVGRGALAPEPSLRDTFRTPDIPMLGVSLFSPHTQVG